MKKAVAYLRVSTDNQIGEDRFGLEVQLQDIQKYADINNIELIAVYKELGVSGSKLIRPALSKLYEHAETGEFQFVIIAKLDRIARELSVQLWIEKELLRSNIEIISVAEPMRCDDPMGKLFRQIMGSFAEFERNRITERLTSGRIAKAKTGKYAGGRPCFGYVSDKENKALKINKIKVNVVRRVFELHEQGVSFGKIAIQLNEEGHTTAQNKLFQPMQVKRIVDHKQLYSGIYSYANVTSQVQDGSIVII